MRREISLTFMSGPSDGKKLSFAQPEVTDERVITIGRREDFAPSSPLGLRFCPCHQQRLSAKRLCPHLLAGRWRQPQWDISGKTG